MMTVAGIFTHRADAQPAIDRLRAPSKLNVEEKTCDAHELSLSCSHY